MKIVRKYVHTDRYYVLVEDADGYRCEFSFKDSVPDNNYLKEMLAARRDTERLMAEDINGDNIQ